MINVYFHFFLFFFLQTFPTKFSFLSLIFSCTNSTPHLLQTECPLPPLPAYKPLLFKFLFYRYVLIVSMGFMSVAHLYRQITDYGGYTLDFTGQIFIIMMIIGTELWTFHEIALPLFTVSKPNWKLERLYLRRGGRQKT